MNAFMKQKLLSAKEDLLQSNLKAKRNMRLMVEVHPLHKVSLNTTEWKVRMEGRLMSESEEDILLRQDAYQESKRFLNYFEKVRVEFKTGTEEIYPVVEWVKAKSEAGSSFDCFEIARVVTKDQKKKLGDTPITVKMIMSLENNPKRYRVSPQLSRVLGGIEEVTRLQVVGALWQYVKSNRLQDSDNRDLINCNQELAEVFGCGVGDEKLDFHQAVFRLKDHLYDVPPVELIFDINLQQASKSTV